MPDIVLHVWETEDGWEIRASDEAFELAKRTTRETAIDWCQEHAEELGATIIYVWELEVLRRLVA